MSEHATAQKLAETFPDIDADTPTEHVSMGSDLSKTSNASETSAVELKDPSAQFKYANLLDGCRFKYSLYSEGYLKIRQWRKNELEQDYYLALRFLNPKPILSRFIAKRTFMVAAGLLVAGLASAALNLFLPFDATLRAITIVFCSTSAIAGFLGMHWSQERTRFHTATGECEVLRLIGTVESYRTCRKMVPAICAAIRDAQKINPDDRQLYLREEMHDHYRLSRTNAISVGDCSDATRLVLAAFE